MTKNNTDYLQKLIVFTRYPEVGNTKTRLIPALGPEGAAQFQKEMTELTLELVRQVKLTTVELRYEGGNNELIKNWLGTGIYIKSQGGGDLGRKMEVTFEESFDEGIKKIIIIGTDCPGIDPSIIQKAFDALGDNDLVLGPATDGGYYLIGLSKRNPSLFHGVEWGKENVLKKTLNIAEGLRLKTYLLDELSDIDRPEDLHVLRSCLKKEKLTLS